MQEREALKKLLKELSSNNNNYENSRKKSNIKIQLDHLKYSIYNKIQKFRQTKLEYDQELKELIDNKYKINFKGFEDIIKENEYEYKLVTIKLEEKKFKQLSNSVSIQENEKIEEEEFFKKTYFYPTPIIWREQNENLLLVNLQSKSEEFIEIAKYFNETLTTEIISRIIRIQNIQLWKKFLFGKNQLKKKGTESEKMLFYGSKENDPTNIYNEIRNDDGFEIKNATDGDYGYALYFFEKAKHAHNFRYEKNNKNYIFLANVLIGASIKMDIGNNLVKMPPFINKLENIRYDSIKSADGKYMIYNNSRAYPSYLIEY